MSRRKQWRLGLVRKAAKAAADAGYQRDGVTVSTRDIEPDCFVVRSDSYAAVGAIAKALEGAFNVRAMRYTSGPRKGCLRTELEGAWGARARHVVYFVGADNG
jgi:hypothetical protein